MNVAFSGFSVQSSLLFPNGTSGGKPSGKAFDRLLVDLLDSEKKAGDDADNTVEPVEAADVSGPEFPSGETATGVSTGGESAAGGGGASLGGLFPGGEALDAAVAESPAEESVTDDKTAQDAWKDELMRMSFRSSVYDWRKNLGALYENEEDKNDPAGDKVAELVGPERAKSPEVTGLPRLPERSASMRGDDADGSGDLPDRPFKVTDSYEARKKAGAKKTLRKVEAGEDDEQGDEALTGKLFGKEMSELNILQEQVPGGQALAAKIMGDDDAYLPNGMLKNPGRASLLNSLAGGFSSAQDWLQLNYGAKSAGGAGTGGTGAA